MTMKNWSALSCGRDEHCRKAIGNLEKWTDLLSNLGVKKKPIVQQSHESAVSKKPRIGDRVQVKGSSPRGTLKVDRVIEMIENQDGKGQAATVMVPNKSIFQKSIIHMYPLEFNDEEQL